MNSQSFKKLIKEAVREAVREELKQVLAEHAASMLAESYVRRAPLQENLDFSSMDVGPTHFPKTPKQQYVDKSKMDKLFKPAVPVTPMNDWSLGADLNRPEPVLKSNKPAIAGGGDFSAFLMDTAQNLTPQEISQMRMGGGD